MINFPYKKSTIQYNRDSFYWKNKSINLVFYDKSKERASNASPIESNIMRIELRLLNLKKIKNALNLENFGVIDLNAIKEYFFDFLLSKIFKNTDEGGKFINFLSLVEKCVLEDPRNFHQNLKNFIWVLLFDSIDDYLNTIKASLEGEDIAKKKVLNKVYRIKKEYFEVLKKLGISEMISPYTEIRDKIQASFNQQNDCVEN